jgi:DNA invertase Pin-like site-specific DNA recombinase
VFHGFAALAEFERDLIRERAYAGLVAARARGRTGGRPPRLSPDQVRTARRLNEQQDMTVAQIRDVYRALRRESEPVAGRRGKTSG